MNTTITIQPYSTDYQKQVIALILPIQQKEFQISISEEDQPDLYRIPEIYQSGKGNFWIAKVDQQVIGTIGLLDIGNNELALRKMFVDETYRGKTFQVASTLLQQAMQWSKDQCIQRIFLGTTAQFLAAHRFYEKNRFEKISEKDLPESFPVMKVDTFFYRLDL